MRCLGFLLDGETAIGNSQMGARPGEDGRREPSAEVTWPETGTRVRVDVELASKVWTTDSDALTRVRQFEVLDEVPGGHMCLAIAD